MENNILEQAYSVSHFEEFLPQFLAEFKARIKPEATSKVIDWKNPETELDFWKNYLKEGHPNQLFPELFKRTTHIQHPKYVGHQVASPTPITSLTAMAGALMNNGMAVYEMGMSPSAIERIVTDIICETIGYTTEAGGFLTSGGTLANLTALLAARRTKVKEDIWNDGYTKPLGILVCEEAHYCIDRAARIMGLGSKGIIKIAAKANYSMDTDQLAGAYQEALDAGIQVFAIVGSAPSTATGAYDDLAAIAQFAKEKDLWFHVDGAHGGAAIFSKKYKHLLDGAAEADSMIIDGHKMLMMPVITTALVFKNKWHAQQTFSQQADYLLDDSQEDQWYQSGKKTFECTKTMMSLHWFILIKFYGLELFDAFVTRQYNLAKDFAAVIQNTPNFELAVAPQSNIVCFRYVKEGMSAAALNQLNAAIRQQTLEEGEYYMVQTKLRGTHYLRTSLMNPFTTLEHLKDLLQKISDLALKNC
ncbi:pyridoxal phosphate-dependent decarboxylase family protein [Croceivirga sp. JEA036]|uniref:pyridoxal phosphate-dependent decarboxylase family protein n=1 Tax=Croceivirga sp. JEA036 TaxID=2721162 RepID=UPI00143AF2BF|nr:aminotransferase class I/II-fold pyridoxal phosphate-dependent enzyme [Croceivirga sp. JEA036]NJB37974.1 aspartate aminotransferase family protein [Croceivirga sp. JEA036]